MPTYDYKCTECNITFEEFQKMTDKPLKKCPECGGKLKRLIGAGATPIFKGSGFYQTDYKNSGGPEKEKKTVSKSENAQPAKETKTESKKTDVKSSDKNSNDK